MNTVKDVMTRKVITVSPETTIRRTIEILMENQVSGLPVVDADRQLIGVISEFALLEALYDPSILDDHIEAYMSKEPITVDVEATFADAANLLLLHRIRRLPVLENDQLVGLVSRRTLLAALLQTEQPLLPSPSSA